jgi:hypothetical protein
MENRKIFLLSLELNHDSSAVQPVSYYYTYSFSGHYSLIILAFRAIGLSLEMPRASFNKSRKEKGELVVPLTKALRYFRFS